MREKKQIRIWIVYLVTLVVAFCSIAYELLIAHSVSLAAGNSVTWYGIIVGSYLGSLGVGAFFVSKFITRTTLSKRFIILELILTAVGMSVAAFVSFLQMFNAYLIVHGQVLGGKILFVGGVLLIVFVVGFLSGIELPLLMKIGNKVANKNVINRVLAADYFGSLLGAVAFPLVLIVAFNVYAVGLLIAALNFSAAVFLFFFQKRKKGLRPLEVFVGGILLFTLIFGLSNSQTVEQYFVKKYYLFLPSSKNLKTLLEPIGGDDIFRVQSKYQAIDIVSLEIDNSQSLLMDAFVNDQCSSSVLGEGTMLYLNGNWQLNVSTEKIYHEYFAHVPILFNDFVPENVLVLGGGDGALDRELLKHEEVKSIIHVELDEKIIELARSNQVLLEMNEGSLDDERVEVIIGDGFSFLRNTKQKFDAIYIDFPSPVDYDLAKLYSQEFYSFAKKALNDDGFIALDIPGTSEFFKYSPEGKLVIEQSGSPFDVYYNAISAAGFETIKPFASNLDRDNPVALAIAKDRFVKEYSKNINSTKNKFLIDKKSAQRAKEYVEKFALKTQEAFLFARPDNFEINEEYKKLKANNCIMNKDRFELAQSVQFKVPDKDEKANSIIKPIIPLSSFSQIKLPYYLQ